MRLEEIRVDEDRRLDLFLMRTMTGYTERNARLFVYFNPRLDILNLVAGTKVWVPDTADIRKVTDLRGWYSLVR